ncbi:MAG: DNA polymerase III subunit delta [Clostridiales bacterium]|nr:DNA polymerase III subunit delta [Clostridiales bacterium]
MAEAAKKRDESKGTLNVEAAIRQIREGGIRPVYLLYGEEAFLQERFLLILKEVWLGPDAGAYAITKEDGKTMTQAKAVDLASQISLLSGRNLIQIDEPVFIPGGKEQRADKVENADVNDPATGGLAGEDAGEDAGEGAEGAAMTTAIDDAGFQPNRKLGNRHVAPQEKQALLAYLEQPNDRTCLVLRMRKGKPDRRHKLVAEIAKGDGLVEAAVLTPERRTPYLKEALQRLGKQCAPDLLARIARQPGGLAFCVHELEKLAAFAGEESVIRREMLDQVLTPNLEADIFRLVDALGRRRRSQALRELQALLQKGEAPFAIFSMMLRQFRLIFKAKACLQENMGNRQIAQALGLRDFVAKNAAEQSKLFSFAALERIMALFCEKDLAMKSTGAGEYPKILADLVIALGD